jgi:phenylacetate-CoA ligase
MAERVPADKSAGCDTGTAGVADRQQTALAALLHEIIGQNPYYTRKLANVSFGDGPIDLTALPLTTRAELHADQQAHPPFGSNQTYPLARYTRFHQTSGTSGTPLRWLDTPESWAWFCGCWADIYRAADVTADDRIVFPFSFGPFIGFWAAFEAAGALDALALPAGGMSTAARLHYLQDNGATVVCCTPTYAVRMGEEAAKMGLDLPAGSVRGLIVAGEPGGNIPAVRARIEAGWGARVYDHVGMTEVGAWGYERTADPGVLRILENEFIAEVIDPESATVVADGQPGELVLTNLGRWGSPLIRYRTGDRVTLQRDADGRAWIAGGVAGRIDDMLFVRGNNVFPSAIEALVREQPGIAEFRLRVRRVRAMDALTVELEPRADAEGPALAAAVRDAIRDRLHFSAEVRWVAPGTLPRFELKARRVVREEADD